MKFRAFMALIAGMGALSFVCLAALIHLATVREFNVAFYWTVGAMILSVCGPAYFFYESGLLDGRRQAGVPKFTTDQQAAELMTEGLMARLTKGRATR